MAIVPFIIIGSLVLAAYGDISWTMAVVISIGAIILGYLIMRFRARKLAKYLLDNERNRHEPKN